MCVYAYMRIVVCIARWVQLRAAIFLALAGSGFARRQIGDHCSVGRSGGSRSATITGGVTLLGARQLKAKVLDVAALLIEARAQDLEITDGQVIVRGDPDTAIPVAEVARQAASRRFGADVDATLEVEATYDGGEGGWSGGSHCAIVEVDVETVIVKVERYVATEDCGALINPAVVEGQIRGGIAQGIGAVLLERSAYDQDGNYQSATRAGSLKAARRCARRPPGLDHESHATALDRRGPGT